MKFFPCQNPLTLTGSFYPYLQETTSIGFGMGRAIHIALGNQKSLNQKSFVHNVYFIYFILFLSPLVENGGNATKLIRKTEGLNTK